MENSAVYSTILSLKAQKEIENSWAWYEEREPGLGDRYTSEVLKKINTLADAPEIHPVKYKQYRQAIVPVFPFLIIYRINKRQRQIEIVSVFHTSRHPRNKY